MYRADYNSTVQVYRTDQLSPDYEERGKDGDTGEDQSNSEVWSLAVLSDLEDFIMQDSRINWTLHFNM